MIKCKICNKEFKALSHSHLKTHNITQAEYKKKHGDIVTDEYRRKQSIANSGTNNPNYNNRHSDETKKIISSKLKGRIPHNKDIPMESVQKEKLSIKAKQRNALWRETNSHPNTGRKAKPETIDKIRAARKLQIITTESVNKAVQTKRDRGYDLGFFKNHKHTTETKKKISIASAEANKKRTILIDSERISRLAQYGYTLVSKEDNIISIRCGQCSNIFTRTVQYASSSKINKSMCRVCYPPLQGTSTAEHEIGEFLSHHTIVMTSHRGLIPPKEIDIFLPEHNIAIEYNGLYWHSAKFKDKTYHLNKTIQCASKNIRLIHIFEDEWFNSPAIVKSRLLSALGKNKRVFARKCRVSVLAPTIANKFIADNHIQSVGRANVHLGLYLGNELLAVMTFLNGDISKGLRGWELNRFCNKLGYTVVGGASRLFMKFIKSYSPTVVTSYADRRWSNLSPFYTNLGFELEHYSPPNYWYVQENEMKRHHRYGLRKNNKDNASLTEVDNRINQGFTQIYDCGHSKFVWRK